jgi:hypothetical protein
MCVFHLQLWHTYEMADLKEQRAYWQFYFKMSKHAVEYFDILKIAFVEQRWGRTRAYNWFLKFRIGATSVESAVHLVRLSASKKKGLLSSSTLLCSVGWLSTIILAQCISPIFKGQESSVLDP